MRGPRSKAVIRDAVRRRLEGRRRSRLALAVAAGLAGAASAGPAGATLADVRVQHTPAVVVEAGRPLSIEASVAGGFPLDVATADVVVLAGAGERAVPLSLSQSLLRADIPADLVQSPELRYYLRIVDLSGDVLTAPPGSPEAGTYTVGVVGAGTARGAPEPAGRGVHVLTPLPGEVVGGAAPDIAAMLDPPLEEPWMAVLLLDGRDVTADAEVLSDYFYLSPAESLSNGGHSVTFSALTLTRAVEETWTFFVRETTPAGPTVEPGTAVRPRATEAIEGGGEFIINGRAQVGWAAVAAETTAVESLSVFLPYDEQSAPSLDLYVSALGPSLTGLATARYDPLYDDRLTGSLLLEAPSFDLEAGDIFPSLTRSTLDWASGLGVRAGFHAGPMRTDVTAVRLAEADTVGGVGSYAQYALGAKETVEWGQGDSAALAYVRAFDDERSVPEEDRVIDATDSDVLAATLTLESGGRLVDAEVARSWLAGGVDERGGHFRIRAGYEKDHANRVIVEYSRTDTSFYSRGSIATEPGRHGAGIEVAYGPGTVARFLVTADAHRIEGAALGTDPDAWCAALYGRLDLSWSVAGGDVRGYAVARYDRTPYEEYEYRYVQGAGGCSYRRGKLSAALSLSWSRASSDGDEDTVGAGADLRWELIPGRLSGRASTRWSVGSGEGSDYTRATHTAGVRWDAGVCDLSAEYRYLERDDRASPDDGYTEHVGLVSVGRRF